MIEIRTGITSGEWGCLERGTRELSGATERFDILTGIMGTQVYTRSKIMTYIHTEELWISLQV